MKTKKIIMSLLAMSTVILAGCNFGQKSSNKKPRSTSSSSVAPVDPAPPIDDHEGTPGEGEIEDKHITGISMKYTKDFFMKNKTTLDFSVTFKGGGGDEEKGIDWASSNPKVLQVDPNPNKTYQCVLSALKEGSATLVARSQYNRSLTCSVTITVIDNSDYTYMWQMNKTGETKDDAVQFNGDDGKPLSEGTVTFSGIEWDFKFDTPTKSVGGGQQLTFGSKDYPYGNIEFKTANTRYIRKISVLCASAGYKTGQNASGYDTTSDVGSSNLTVTIGNTKYIDSVPTPKNSNNDEAEMMTGGEFNDKVLTGDIKIHFSPTYKDPQTKINSGAIYLKSIIIEYYRGDLQKIEVDSETSEHPTAFFKGTKFDTTGLVVNAFFSESSETKVNVTHLASITTTNVDGTGVFQNEAASQDVNISYSYKKGNATQTQTTSYPIVVYPKLKGIQIVGEIEKSEYLIYDEIDYSGIKVNLMADAEEPVLTYELKDFKTSQFKSAFNITQVHEYATKALQNGFTISIKHLLTGVSGSYTFQKNDLTVKQVSKIEVMYKTGSEDYAPKLTEGEKMDYSEFNAKVSYDDESSETFKFSELSSQTYLDPNNSNKKTQRYDYASHSPLVVSKSMQTEGFSVSVKCDLANKVGTLEIPADQVSVKAIQSVQIVCNSLLNDDYDEHDLMDYTGVQIVITYDDSTSLTLPYAEALEYMIYIQEDNKAKATPLFNFDFPNEATMDMMNNGFTLRVTTSIGELENELEVNANTIHVTPYVAKTYTKVKSNADFDAEGYYIITCIDHDDTTKTKVWNGALDKDHIWETNKPEDGKYGNYLTYNHSTSIGDSLVIDDASVERAAFYITKNNSEEIELSDGSKVNPVTVYLASTVGTSSELKLSINDSNTGSFVKTTSSNADRQKLITMPVNDDYHSIQIGYSSSNYKRYICYNKDSKADRFGTLKVTSPNFVSIQIYKINL